MRYATPATAAAVSLALAACATPTRDKALPSEHAVSQRAGAGNRGKPTNPAEALGQKLLALIGGLRSKRDLTVERVNAALGVRMEEHSELPGRYKAKVPLTDQWHSWVRFQSATANSEARMTVAITSDLTTPLPLTDVCLEFEPFAAALERLGYTMEEQKTGFNIDPTGNWRFYRRKPDHEYTEEELLDIIASLEGAGPVEILINRPRDEFSTEFGQSAGGRSCITHIEVEAKGGET